jgi:CubicO group peptidase (beta-lactamase class C family)
MARFSVNRRALLLGAAALAAGCTHAAPNEAIAPNVLATTPENQAATFRHADQSAPIRVIRRGRNVLAMPRAPRQLGDFTYAQADATRSVSEYMARNRTSGLIIVKDGAIALERHAMGNDEASRWTSFSTAKSMTSLLAGAAVQDGAIKSLDDPAERYLPVLQGSAYEGVSVRNILRMCSGVAWNEEYSATGDNDIARLAAAMAENRPGALMDHMRSLHRATAQGAKFNYSTGESYVLGAIVAAATGKHLADYYSEKIWSRLGMEADGYWQLESTDGQEAGGYGVSATLRDYARIGLFMLNDGVIGGERVLPEGWRDLAGHPDIAATAYGQLDAGYPLGYGYQWWSFPSNVPELAAHAGAFTAQGIFGQFIYINPRERVVAAIWSAWRDAWQTPAEMETYALLTSAIERLR